uniref:Secreted protein n=1 Tax=Cacopsylla melanoneura TaxID=428564 RepID=A0A8D8T2L8_9HEMI
MFLLPSFSYFSMFLLLSFSYISPCFCSPLPFVYAHLSSKGQREILFRQVSPLMICKCKHFVCKQSEKLLTWLSTSALPPSPPVPVHFSSPPSIPVHFSFTLRPSPSFPVCLCCFSFSL